LRDKAILEVLLHTGLKVSELVSLNREQLDLERKQISRKSKGNKIRILFLPDAAAQWIGRYLQSRRDKFKPLFICHSGELDTRKSGERMRLTVRSIQNIATKYTKRCGLPIKATPQTLRHCFALYLAGKGANPVPLQVLFGHESLDGITRYIHASDNYAEETYRKYYPPANQD
jgi:site-specific recombinase XerD